MVGKSNECVLRGRNLEESIKMEIRREKNRLRNSRKKHSIVKKTNKNYIPTFVNKRIAGSEIIDVYIENNKPFWNEIEINSFYDRYSNIDNIKNMLIPLGRFRRTFYLLEFNKPIDLYNAILLIDWWYNKPATLELYNVLFKRNDLYNNSKEDYSLDWNNNPPLRRDMLDGYDKIFEIIINNKYYELVLDEFYYN